MEDYSVEQHATTTVEYFYNTQCNDQRSSVGLHTTTSNINGRRFVYAVRNIRKSVDHLLEHLADCGQDSNSSVIEKLRPGPNLN